MHASDRVCVLCEFVAVPRFLPSGLRYSCRFARLSTRAVLFFVPRVMIHPRSWQVMTFRVYVRPAVRRLCELEVDPVDPVALFLELEVNKCMYGM